MGAAPQVRLQNDKSSTTLFNQSQPRESLKQSSQTPRSPSSITPRPQAKSWTSPADSVESPGKQANGSLHRARSTEVTRHQGNVKLGGSVTLPLGRAGSAGLITHQGNASPRPSGKGAADVVVGEMVDRKAVAVGQDDGMLNGKLQEPVQPSMSKPVTLDIDEVLLDLTGGFRHFLEETYPHMKVPSDEELQLLSGDGSSPLRTAFLESQIFSELPAISGAVEAVQRLHEAGYRLEAVTARPPSLAEVTQAVIDRKFSGMISKIHYTTGLPKGSFCQQLDAWLLVDDSLGHVRDVVAHGLSAILFGEYPWNQNKELPPNVVHLRHWADTVQWIMNRCPPSTFQETAVTYQIHLQPADISIAQSGKAEANQIQSQPVEISAAQLEEAATYQIAPHIPADLLQPKLLTEICVAHSGANRMITRSRLVNLMLVPFMAWRQKFLEADRDHMHDAFQAAMESRHRVIAGLCKEQSWQYDDSLVLVARTSFIAWRSDWEVSRAKRQASKSITQLQNDVAYLHGVLEKFCEKDLSDVATNASCARLEAEPESVSARLEEDLKTAKASIAMLLSENELLKVQLSSSADEAFPPQSNIHEPRKTVSFKTDKVAQTSNGPQNPFSPPKSPIQRIGFKSANQTNEHLKQQHTITAQSPQVTPRTAENRHNSPVKSTYMLSPRRHGPPQSTVYQPMDTQVRILKV